MTEREKRNEEMKARIRRDAETACQFIDLLESELKQRERMNQELAERLDRQNKAA
jgi:hypothetical protein